MAQIIKDLFAYIEQLVWNILNAQQNFVFINGPRGCGKTYTFYKILVKHCLRKGIEFCLIFRTKLVIVNDDALTSCPLMKVLRNEYPDLEWRSDKWHIIIKYIDDKTGKETERVLVRALALSDAGKSKNKTELLNVYYIVFDEYMIDPKLGDTYLHGYKEPDMILTLYETVDRETDRIKFIFLGNNTAYYNPYHVHNAFNCVFRGIPKKGEIRKAENIMFVRIDPPAELKEVLANTRFARMTQGTDYAKSARDGEYEDDISAIVPLPTGAKTKFVLHYNDVKIFVHEGYNDESERCYWLSSKGDDSVEHFAVRGNDIVPGRPMFGNVGLSALDYQLFRIMYNAGRVYFSDSYTKGRAGDFLYCILSGFRKI